MTVTNKTYLRWLRLWDDMNLKSHEGFSEEYKLDVVRRMYDRSHYDMVYTQLEACINQPIYDPKMKTDLIRKSLAMAKEKEDPVMNSRVFDEDVKVEFMLNLKRHLAERSGRHLFVLMSTGLFDFLEERILPE